MSRILAIGSGISDLGVSCFGTLAKHAAQGAETYALLMTARKKDAEAERVAKKMGVARIYFTDHFSYSEVTQDNVNVLRSVVEELRPSLVIIPSTKTLDKKLAVLAGSAMLACRSVESILMYEAAPNNDFNPSVYSVIADEFVSKIDALAGKNVKIKEKLQSMHRRYSRQTGLDEPVEVFESHRLVLASDTL